MAGRAAKVLVVVEVGAPGVAVDQMGIVPRSMKLPAVPADRIAKFLSDQQGAVLSFVTHALRKKKTAEEDLHNVLVELDVADDLHLVTSPCFRQNVMLAAINARFLSVLQVKSLCIAAIVLASKLLPIRDERIDPKKHLVEMIIKMACAENWPLFKASLMPSSQS